MVSTTGNSIAFLLSLLIPLAAMGQSATTPVALRVLPDATLPGMPVAFAAKVTAGTEALTVFGMSLEVASPSATFLAEGPGSREVQSLSGPGLDQCGEVHCLHVAPNSSRELWVEIDPSLTGNIFFFDKRLYVPGTYDLRLQLLGNKDGGGVFTIESSPVRLVVQEPRGEDAQAWAFMNASVPGGWRPDSGFMGVIEEFPSSRYAAYAVLTQANFADFDTAEIDRAAAMDIPIVVRELLLLAKADVLHARRRQALHSRRNLEEAMWWLDQARELYQSLIHSAVSVEVRARATDAKAKVYTRAGAIESLEFFQNCGAPAPRR
jgi:hypothetical protein